MTQVITKDGFVDDIWAGAETPELSEYAGGISLLLPVDIDPSAVEQYFDDLELIVIPFGSSADGRGFSLSAQLRALGFTGHVRGRGHILVDQFRMATRSGFTDLEISDDQAARNPEQQWLEVSHAEGYLPHLMPA